MVIPQTWGNGREIDRGGRRLPGRYRCAGGGGVAEGSQRDTLAAC